MLPHDWMKELEVWDYCSFNYLGGLLATSHTGGTKHSSTRLVGNSIDIVRLYSIYHYSLAAYKNKKSCSDAYSISPGLHSYVDAMHTKIPPKKWSHFSAHFIKIIRTGSVFVARYNCWTYKHNTLQLANSHKDVSLARFLVLCSST